MIKKYVINIGTIVEYNYLDYPHNSKFTIVESGDYVVDKQHSKTVNNEKNLIKDLVDSLSEKLLLNLTIKLNDL